VLCKSALAVTLLVLTGLTRDVVNVLAVAVRLLSLSDDFDFSFLISLQEVRLSVIFFRNVSLCPP
jgi:hypothetical protein